MKKIDQLINYIHSAGYPIPFIEYYSHLHGDCYKFLNPFTRFQQDKIVLCGINDGFLTALEKQKTWIDEQPKQNTN